VGNDGSGREPLAAVLGSADDPGSA